jgi:predicted metalloendopeptidase
MGPRAALLLACLLAAFASPPPAPPPLKSGIDPAELDASVRPQNDLFAFANGAWLKRTEIPEDRVWYGTFIELAERADLDIRAIIEEEVAKPDRRAGSTSQQIADLYASMMNEARLEELGALPIKPELDRIDAIRTTNDLAAEMGRLSALGAGGPFPSSVESDVADPNLPVVRVGQGGTLLPDRDYYTKGDAPSVEIRAKYESYLSKMFTLAGRSDPLGRAKAVLALETSLAEAQWSQVESRAAALTNSRFRLFKLPSEMPGFDWPAFAKPQGLDGAADVILVQPSFFKAFAQLVRTAPLDDWKAWLLARYLTAQAPFLSRVFIDARFDFFGTVLSGQELPFTRWKRGVSLVNGYLGDAVGRIYAQKRFPPAAKTRMLRIVTAVLAAYRQSIRELPWMSDSAKAEAMDKVVRMHVRVGAPENFRDYRGLIIRADDLMGNVERLKKFENDQKMARLLARAEGGDWLITPQTVNAYYSATRNEIVFPAAVLQPPLFDLEAEDAVNYGAIGAIIGHEIGHALDERGRFYDGAGSLRDWWKAQDERGYQARARVLIEQFEAMSPAPGLHVNGELTLRENVGDLGGLEIAYRAYRSSLAGAPSPRIDGLSGEQRFFIGWARAWRLKMRDEYLRQSLLKDPYAPGSFRANGPASNLAGFYEAFEVRPADRMYRDPSKRVRIWSSR